MIAALLYLLVAARPAPVAHEATIRELTPREQLQRARDAFDEYKYEQAVAQLKTLLQNPPADAALRQDAIALLAFSDFYRNDEAAAKAELAKLFRENANYAIDRDALHPNLVRFYDREHAAFVAPIAPLVVRRQTLGDRQPWLRIFPLGIGHFANRDRLAGGLFLGSEALLVGANIAATVLRYGLRDNTGAYRAGTNPVPAEVVQNAAAFTLVAVVIVELIDAFAWSPARGRATLPAEVP